MRINAMTTNYMVAKNIVQRLFTVHDVRKVNPKTDLTLVTALIRYIYKELAKAVRPSYSSSTKQRDSLSFTSFPTAPLAFHQICSLTPDVVQSRTHCCAFSGAWWQS
jgi:hypothetical protein